jgi:hypothetical protein
MTTEREDATLCKRTAPQAPPLANESRRNEPATNRPRHADRGVVVKEMDGAIHPTADRRRKATVRHSPVPRGTGFQFTKAAESGRSMT